jgi:hypothetical protein
MLLKNNYLLYSYTETDPQSCLAHAQGDSVYALLIWGWQIILRNAWMRTIVGNIIKLKTKNTTLSEHESWVEMKSFIFCSRYNAPTRSKSTRDTVTVMEAGHSK